MIILSGFIQSLVGICQFAIQHSIGLLWLKESIISPKLPGVAKIIFNGEPFIRSYGLFPHPNILGGFLVLSIILTITYIKMFHVEHFERVRDKALLYAVLMIQCLALVLTFSKSAIFGLFIGFLYLSVTKCSTWNILRDKNGIIVPRGTIINKLPEMFHVEHFYRKLFLIACILILLLAILKTDMNSLFIKSFSEREFYLNVSRGTFLSHPLIGIGAGQFVPNMLVLSSIQDWQYQPVHNVFLLILNEFGIFLLLAFVYFLFKLFYLNPMNCSTWNNSISSEMKHATKNTNVPRGTFYGAGVEQFKSKSILLGYFKAILLSFTFIMLFDHYFWDIQQGQIMLWLILGFIASRAGK